MKNYVTKLLVLTLITSIFSCAASQKAEEKAMNKEVSQQAPADTPEAIAERAAQVFSSVEGLTTEQKTKLALIYKNVYLESMQIRREIGQSKSLLFTTLAKVDYKSSEINNLKKKIVGLDQRRLSLMFEAMADVQKIVGKGKTAEKIYKHFEDNEIPKHWMKDYTY